MPETGLNYIIFQMLTFISAAINLAMKCFTINIHFRKAP